MSVILAGVRVLGLDGCPGGWAGALVEGRSVELRRFDGLAAGLTEALAVDVDLVAVDIPVGLPATGAARACDAAARAYLGRQGSSVFPAPSRALLGLGTHAATTAASVRLTGRGISIQAYGIYPRIAAVDGVVTAAVQRRLLEAHPEIAFRLLAGGRLGSKHTVAGRDVRADLLATVFDRPLPATGPWLRGAKRDDVLDALVCAWTAQRWLAGTALLLPDDPERDAHGLLMGIAG